MKTIIAGSRNFTDFHLLCSVCDEEAPITEIISGTAIGADQLGEKYALEKGIKLHQIAPDWQKYGRRATLVRNETMAKEGDRLIAFWDGKSRGTKHMLKMAKKYKLKIRIVEVT